jgi:hypothetical protein
MVHPTPGVSTSLSKAVYSTDSRIVWDSLPMVYHLVSWSFAMERESPTRQIHFYLNDISLDRFSLFLV